MLHKRHTKQEVTALLQQAEEMAEKGKNQQEISRSLGVSVMTIHRWRKRKSAASSSGSAEAFPTRGAAAMLTSKSTSGALQHDRPTELQLENTRLRRLVTDLLLEKLQLEEELQQSVDSRNRRLHD